jgi:hypothetical protein
MAQKVNLDTLDIDQLNHYKDKAVAMRNTGRVLTYSGACIVVTGIIVGVVFMNVPNPDPIYDTSFDAYHDVAGIGIMCLGGLVGIPCIAVGIPLRKAGDIRLVKAEFRIRKFNIAPKTSMTVGLGITIRF